MREFGLTYEGYDLPRDIYITDSEGQLKSSEGTCRPSRTFSGRVEPPSRTGASWGCDPPGLVDLRKRAPEGRPPVGLATFAPELVQRSARRRLAEGLRRVTKR